MSVKSDQIFNTVNKLKYYEITIGNIKVLNETILSLDIKYVSDSPVVKAKLVINDIIDLNHQLTWRDVTVKIHYRDIFDGIFTKNFTITSVIEKYDDKFLKVFVLELQDTFSYKLSKSFISKGYTNAKITTAVSDYVTELDVLDADTVTDFDESGNRTFTVPKNESNLSFFTKELRRHGFVFYQTKTTVAIKHLDSIVPSLLPDNGIFVNETDNQYYKNRIYELRMSFNNRNSIPVRTRSFGYNFITKTINESIVNDPNVLALSTDQFNLQEENGYFDLAQSHLDFDEHLLKLRSEFIKQSTVQIVTNGYAKNDMYELYELNLKGNISTPETQSSGNRVLNGKYVCTGIQDKLIGDSLVQLIDLNRADLNKGTK